VAASRSRFKVLAAGRRFGKTSLGGTLCLRTALEGGRAWWVAPTFPLAQVGWRVLKVLSRKIPRIEIREADRMVVLPGGGEIQVKSADNPDSLRGTGLDGVVLDEAAYVKEEAWTESLRPALPDRQGWALFISTPDGLNWFHRLYERAARLAGWQAWQCPTWENPRIAPEELDHAREQMGELVFRQEFGAEFLDFGTLQPFRAEWIRYWGRDGEPDPPPPGHASSSRPASTRPSASATPRRALPSWSRASPECWTRGVGSSCSMRKPATGRSGSRWTTS
jgi:hypothetical protein